MTAAIVFDAIIDVALAYRAISTKAVWRQVCDQITEAEFADALLSLRRAGLIRRRRDTGHIHLIDPRDGT